MPGRDVTVKGTFLANTGTKYSVEHYLEGNGGSYNLKDTTSHTGTTGDTAYAMPGNYPGYTHNASHADAVESGTIAGDGSLVLKLYYDKTPYKVYYSITGTAPQGVTAPAAQTHDYSDKVTLEPITNVAGYRFEGWLTDDVTLSGTEFTMPAHDVYFIGYYVKTVSS